MGDGGLGLWAGGVRASRPISTTNSCPRPPPHSPKKRPSSAGFPYIRGSMAWALLTSCREVGTSYRVALCHAFPPRGPQESCVCAQINQH